MCIIVLKFSYTMEGFMNSDTITAICEGRSFIKKIVVSANIANPARHTCNKGEKTMERLFYITKGCFYITEKNCEEIIANEGTLLFLPADVEYTSYWDSSKEGSYIAFNYELYDQTCAPLHLNEHIISVLYDKNLAIYHILKESLNTYIQNERFSELALQSLFYKLIYKIFRQQEQKSIKSNKHLTEIYKAIVYLEDHYMSEINTEKLAEMCNMSVSTFRRIFKKYKEASPMQYKQKLRLNHAKSMLESGVYNVTEVSEIMNCTDLSHFNRLYIKEFGINPSLSKKQID